jgi:predicted transposase/invertase (TIGR01784 family)
MAKSEYTINILMIEGSIVIEIETIASITPEEKIILDLPQTIAPGKYKVRLVIDELDDSKGASDLEREADWERLEQLIEDCSIDDRDFNNAVNTAKQEGRKEVMKEMAMNMKRLGMTSQDIASCTDLSLDEIEQL